MAGEPPQATVTIPVQRKSHSFTLTEYDAYQERLRAKNWSLKDLPANGSDDAEADPLAWRDIDYLDVYEQTYGRKCGAAGIGKLREVGITLPSPDDEYSNHPYFHEDREYMNRDGFFLLSDKVDVAKLADEAAKFAEAFETNGVKVYWVRYPERPIAAFGPMMNMHSAAELLIVPGGSIIPKKGYALAPTAGLGRAEYLARWAFWNLGIPPLVTVTGTGVYVCGIFIADDVYMQGMGVETNWEGLEQVAPVLRRACGEDLHIQSIRTPGWRYFDKLSGANTHAGMVISGIARDAVLIHAPGIDIATYEWLKRHGYKIIEVDLQEQIYHSASATVVLEPGHIMMHARATKSIAAVRNAGYEVTPIEYDEYNKYGAAITCATMLILRDPGPRKLS
jgi:N-dimethylarginine dimethylaminohydrolase